MDTITHIDSYHHHYHFQSSTQYLWLGEVLCILEDYEGAFSAFKHALFQDHLNQYAKAGIAFCTAQREGKNNGTYEARGMFHYANHPLFDSAFCASVGLPYSDAGRQHDEAARFYQLGDYLYAFHLLNVESSHSNSHLLAGKCLVGLKRYTQAVTHFNEAIRLSQRMHEEYHRFASDAHLHRGNVAFGRDEPDIAIAEYSKALDLDSHNLEARKARANAYRYKGNSKMAEADETELIQMQRTCELIP